MRLLETTSCLPWDTKHQKKFMYFTPKPSKTCYFLWWNGHNPACILLSPMKNDDFHWQSSNVLDFSPISWMNLMKISLFIDESKIHAWFFPFHKRNVIFSMFCAHGSIYDGRFSHTITITIFWWEYYLDASRNVDGLTHFSKQRQDYCSFEIFSLFLVSEDQLGERLMMYLWKSSITDREALESNLSV